MSLWNIAVCASAIFGGGEWDLRSFTHGAVESPATVGIVGISSNWPCGRGGFTSSLANACCLRGLAEVIVGFGWGDGSLTRPEEGLGVRPSSTQRRGCNWAIYYKNWACRKAACHPQIDWREHLDLGWSQDFLSRGPYFCQSRLLG